MLLLKQLHPPQPQHQQLEAFHLLLKMLRTKFKPKQSLERALKRQQMMLMLLKTSLEINQLLSKPLPKNQRILARLHSSREKRNNCQKSSNKSKSNKKSTCNMRNKKLSKWAKKCSKISYKPAELPTRRSLRYWPNSSKNSRLK